MGSTGSRIRFPIDIYSAANNGFYGYYNEPYFYALLPIRLEDSLYGGGGANVGNDGADVFLDFWRQRMLLERQRMWLEWQIHKNNLIFWKNVFN